VSKARSVHIITLIVAAVLLFVATWFLPVYLYSLRPITSSLVLATISSLALGVGAALAVRCASRAHKRNLAFTGYLALFLGLVLTVFGFRLSQNYSVHSFRIVGRCTELLRLNGNKWTPPDLHRTGDTTLRCTTVAMLRLEEGEAIVYCALPDAPVRLSLPTTLRVVGKFDLTLDAQGPPCRVTVAGLTTSIWYTDAAEDLPPSRRHPTSGRELAPTDLQERRDVLVVFGALAALMFGLAGILRVLRDLFRGNGEGHFPYS
jgi:hypothetical protein